MVNDLFTCRCCGSSNLHEVFSLPPIPLVGAFTIESKTDVEKFPITLLFCQSCKVLQIRENIDEQILFNQYSFSSSTINSLVRHFEDYAQWIKKLVNPKSVLEVGSNDGILLLPLQKLGIRAFGVDISSNITEIASAKGLNVKNIKFGLRNQTEISSWILEKVDLITASNTFPHNDDPNGFLETARNLLSDRGKISLEVMYAGSLEENLQWDTIYHEHLHFHSLTSLQNLFERNGFYIEHAEITNMHAGSLRVLASRVEGTMSESAQKILQTEELRGLNRKATWIEFATRSSNAIAICRERLIEQNLLGPIAAYGASGRATMWIHAANLNFIQYVVDASPLRAGHYMPGSDIPIQSPSYFKDAPPSAVFVSAWNYFDGIIGQHPEYQGTWIAPLPVYLEKKSENNEKP